MDRKNQTDFTGIRIPEGLSRIIENDVEESKEFASKSDWILQAIRYYAEHREEIKRARETQDTDFIPASKGSVPADMKGQN